jgi:hypothetical protein
MTQRVLVVNDGNAIVHVSVVNREDNGRFVADVTELATEIPPHHAHAFHIGAGSEIIISEPTIAPIETKPNTSTTG